MRWTDGEFEYITIGKSKVYMPTYVIEDEEYVVVAIPPTAELAGGYLGGQASEIETNKGRDLRDGAFSSETWNGIMADVVAFELGGGGHHGDSA